MKSYFKNIIKRIIAIVLLIIVLAISINNSLFIHSHILPDGEVVQHAHPYNTSENPESPFKTHHHSGFEIFLLNNLFSFLWIIIAAVFIVFNKNIQIIKIKNFFFREIYKYTYSLSRAPPIA